MHAESNTAGQPATVRATAPQTRQDDSVAGAKRRAIGALLRCVRTDATAVKKPNGQSAWTRQPLTEARVAKHLTSGPPRGVSFIKAGLSTTMVAGLDFDSHGGATDWAGMVEAARRVAEMAALFGLLAVPFRSSGGRGIHLYFLFDEPQDAYSVRVALVDVLAACGLKNGTKGVAAGEVEVFPKQDAVPLDGFGNQMILPYAGKSVALDPQTFEPIEPEAVRWPVSPAVPQRERPQRVAAEPSFAAAVPIEVVRDAADAIPNDGTEDSPDYDRWHRLICAIHAATGGSGEGLEIAMDFSARNPRHEQAFRQPPEMHAAPSRPIGSRRRLRPHRSSGPANQHGHRRKA